MDNQKTELTESLYADWWRAFEALSAAGECVAAVKRFNADRRRLASDLYAAGHKWDDLRARTGLPKASVGKVVPVGTRRARPGESKKKSKSE